MLLSDVMGRGLLVDCDGEWRSSTLCMVCWIQRPLDMCDIIIRGQSVCIRDDSLFFLLSVFVHFDRFGHKRSREDGVARSDVRLTFFILQQKRVKVSVDINTNRFNISISLKSRIFALSNPDTMSLSTSTSSTPSSTSSSQFSNLDSHSCDTLPPARPSSPSFTVSVSEDQWSSPPRSPSPPHPSLDLPSTILSQPTPRKLCIRHQRIADEGTNLKLQQVRVLSPPFRTILLSLPKSLPPFILLRVTHATFISPIYANFSYILPRPLTSFRLEKENPSMRSGQAFRHPRTPAESLFFGAS